MRSIWDDLPSGGCSALAAYFWLAVVRDGLLRIAAGLNNHTFKLGRFGIFSGNGTPLQIAGYSAST